MAIDPVKLREVIARITDKFAYFKNEEQDRISVAIYEAIINKQKYYLTNFYDAASYWYNLAGALFDNNLIEVWEKLPRQLFLKVFGMVMVNYPNVSTYDSILAILQALYGIDTEITFDIETDCDFCHYYLNINLVIEEDPQKYWVTDDGGVQSNYVVTDDQDYILFQDDAVILTMDEINRLLQALVSFPVTVRTTIS